ncbi:hypothetical protein KQI61_05925 [Anaerocolumna aminovalerica]|uniref:hypothetical protein n=1 Tax=Anaerocolumna aminovalerica TaxID=1527 RepID=UPI001C0F2551|nr:hypothetical protein [Anaerocolumna aminovalerica]MBU5331728.1 hypothetical protein [Anaerocolumna aminovalerica]
MFKVEYYTLGYIKTNDGHDVGNIKQYSDIFYTESDIENIPEILDLTVANLKGLYKYKPVITKIERIKGHL